MNWVLILVIVVLAGYTIAGYSKGFLKIVYSLISWLLILVFVTWATPHINDYLRNNTDIYEKVFEACEEQIQNKTEEQLESGDTSSLTSLTENEMLAEILESLPVEALEQIMNSTAEAADQYLEEQGIYTNLASGIADLIMEGISFVLALILGGIASAIIVKVLGFVSKLPIIGFADSVLGLAAGAVNGLIVVWVAFCLVSLWSATELGSKVIAYIYEQDFLIWLYENNLILSILK